MSVQENKAIARRLIEEGYAKADPGALDEVLSTSYVGHGSLSGSPEDIKQALAEGYAAFPDWQFAVLDIVAEGDQVFLRWEASGTQTGVWAGLPPTNKRMEWVGWTLVRIRDGKIVEGRQIWSLFWFLLQSGVVPPFEEIVKQAQSKQA